MVRNNVKDVLFTLKEAKRGYPDVLRCFKLLFSAQVSETVAAGIAAPHWKHTAVNRLDLEARHVSSSHGVNVGTNNEPAATSMRRWCPVETGNGTLY